MNTRNLRGPPRITIAVPCRANETSEYRLGHAPRPHDGVPLQDRVGAAILTAMSDIIYTGSTISGLY